MAALADAKRLVTAGKVYDVTNHYITRETHPSFGTNRRTVTRVTSDRFYLTQPTRHDGESPVPWPKAAQVQVDEDGTVRLFGGGTSQGPGDLFLTLVPVQGEAGQ